MKVYVGIDLGTTNTKVLVVGESGIEKIIKVKTPKRTLNDVEYFDLDKLERSLEKIIVELQKEYDLSGLCCTSFGESVVPVARGKKLHDPIVWYDTCTKSVQDKYERSSLSLRPTRYQVQEIYIISHSTRSFICTKKILSSHIR